MGYEYIKRPVRSVFGESTFNDLTVADDLRVKGSMRLPVESLTVSTALQNISEAGVTFITVASSGAGRDFRLPQPSAAGLLKFIFVVNDSTSVDTRILTNTTANTFWGTTYNEAALAAASTGSPGGTPAGTVMLGLVSASTTQWAVFPGSTFNWDFAGSTGSTGQ